ncbi:MAG TPA: hypothetical protein VM597_10265 [Gemmataceae bacterium]|nr:hypothetical protein [Gemmataceae bacterium]
MGENSTLVVGWLLGVVAGSTGAALAAYYLSPDIDLIAMGLMAGGMLGGPTGAYFGQRLVRTSGASDPDYDDVPPAGPNR